MVTALFQTLDGKIAWHVLDRVYPEYRFACMIPTIFSREVYELKTIPEMGRLRIYRFEEERVDSKGNVYYFYLEKE